MDAPQTPGVTVSSNRKTLALLGRENLPTIAAVSEPILRLAGSRINPRNNGPIEARANWLNSLSFEDVATGNLYVAQLVEGGLDGLSAIPALRSAMRSGSRHSPG